MTTTVANPTADSYNTLSPVSDAEEQRMDAQAVKSLEPLVRFAIDFVLSQRCNPYVD